MVDKSTLEIKDKCCRGFVRYLLCLDIYFDNSMYTDEHTQIKLVNFGEIREILAGNYK